MYETDGRRRECFVRRSEDQNTDQGPRGNSGSVVSDARDAPGSDRRNNRSATRRSHSASSETNGSLSAIDAVTQGRPSTASGSPRVHSSNRAEEHISRSVDSVSRADTARDDRTGQHQTRVGDTGRQNQRNKPQAEATSSVSEDRLTRLIREAVLAVMAAEKPSNVSQNVSKSSGNSDNLAGFGDNPSAAGVVRKPETASDAREPRTNSRDAILESQMGTTTHDSSISESAPRGADRSERNGAASPRATTRRESAQVVNTSDTFEAQILRIHNEYRTGSRGRDGPINPSLGLSLPALSWDSNLSEFVGTWLDSLVDNMSCAIEHSSNRARQIIVGWERIPIGENLYKFSRSRKIENVDVETALASWYNEIDCYRYGPFQHPRNEPRCQRCQDSSEVGCGACEVSSHVGHFTQMMWSPSTHLGCAYRFCSRPAAIDDPTDEIAFCSVLIGCEYGEAGNIVSQIPFSRSDAEKHLICFSADQKSSRPLFYCYRIAAIAVCIRPST
eukprot:GHVQ01012660.1.p1 GENE.GHVQ01012660.1~~GHVQ01012660.1.p1  ORF type:complete len:503 (+),score=52.92 GHVQ01012660.1:1576-3084(+)